MTKINKYIKHIDQLDKFKNVVSQSEIKRKSFYLSKIEELQNELHKDKPNKNTIKNLWSTLEKITIASELKDDAIDVFNVTVEIVKDIID